MEIIQHTHPMAKRVFGTWKAIVHAWETVNGNMNGNGVFLLETATVNASVSVKERGNGDVWVIGYGYGSVVPVEYKGVATCHDHDHGPVHDCNCCDCCGNQSRTVAFPWDGVGEPFSLFPGRPFRNPPAVLPTHPSVNQ